MNRRDWTFVRHLFHRRCKRCYDRGFYDAAMLQERKDGLLRQGFSERESEELMRIRLEAR